MMRSRRAGLGKMRWLCAHALAQVQYLDNSNIKVPVTLFALTVKITYSNHVHSHTALQTAQAVTHLEH